MHSIPKLDVALPFFMHPLPSMGGTLGRAVRSGNARSVGARRCSASIPERSSRGSARSYLCLPRARIVSVQRPWASDASAHGWSQCRDHDRLMEPRGAQIGRATRFVGASTQCWLLLHEDMCQVPWRPCLQGREASESQWWNLWWNKILWATSAPSTPERQVHRMRMLKFNAMPVPARRERWSVFASFVSRHAPILK